MVGIALSMREAIFMRGLVLILGAVQRQCDIPIIQASDFKATRQDNKINQVKAFMNAKRLKMNTKML